MESSSSTKVLPAMMTNTSLLEDQVSNMAKVLERLMKTIEDKNAQIAFLMNKLENVEEASQANNAATRQAQASGTIATAPRVRAPAGMSRVMVDQHQASRAATTAI